MSGHARHPRIVIVIGNNARMSDTTRDILEEINRSLHRVVIIPYDWVADRAEMMVGNVEKYLQKRHQLAADG